MIRCVMVLLVCMSLLAGCGGSSGGSSEPVAAAPPTLEELAGAWQYAGTAEITAGIDAAEPAVRAAADGIITWVTAEILDDGFVSISLNKGAPPEYTDAYTGFVELTDKAISGRLNFRGTRYTDIGGINLLDTVLGFGTVTGTVNDADSMTLVIENDLRTTEILLERVASDTDPQTDLDEFTGLWDDGLDANSDAPDFALEFDANGLASGTWAGNCTATARLTPLRAPMARIDLAAEGCPDAGNYVGLARVSETCCVTDGPWGFGGGPNLHLLLGNSAVTLPEIYSAPGVKPEQLLGLWTQAVPLVNGEPSGTEPQGNAEIHDGGIAGEGPNGRLRLRLIIQTEDTDSGALITDEYFGELTLDRRALSGRLNYIATAAPGATETRGFVQVIGTAHSADDLVLTLVPATGRTNTVFLTKTGLAEPQADDSFVDFAGLWASNELQQAFVGSTYSFDLTFPSDTGQGFGTLEQDCEFEVDLTHLGGHTKWEWARVRVLGCADDLPYPEPTEWYGYALTLAPLNPDTPMAVFLLGNDAETVFLNGARPPL